MATFNNYDAVELAKLDQTQGSTGTVLHALYTQDGANTPPLPAVTYSKTKYKNSGDQITDNVPTPLQISNTPVGLMDCEALGMILTAMFGIVSPTGTSPYTYTWNSLGDGAPIVFHSNYSGAASSTVIHERALINSIVLSGTHGNANEGKMTTQFGYASGLQTPGQAQPTLSTIDKQECLALGSVTSRATNIQFTPDGGSAFDYHKYTNGVNDLTFNREVTNAPDDLAGEIAAGLARYASTLDAMCNFTYDATTGSGGGSASQPDWTGLWHGYGSTAATPPSTLGHSTAGTATIEIYGGLISGSDYFKLSVSGDAIIINGQADVTNYTCPLTIEFVNTPTVVLINTTASYALPT